MLLGGDAALEPTRTIISLPSEKVCRAASSQQERERDGAPPLFLDMDKLYFIRVETSPISMRGTMHALSIPLLYECSVFA
jgi:hypothetical protein